VTKIVIEIVVTGIVKGDAQDVTTRVTERGNHILKNLLMRYENGFMIDN